jgi:Holliday junction resolvase RusA-like endonuclease
MPRIEIKPLSVNQAWQGRRFKTDKYKRYEQDCLMILPKLTVPEGMIKLTLHFGFSSKNSDADNPVKCFVDILQKKYGFNDSRIYEYSIKKFDVIKGKEFIEFKFDKMR